MPADTLEDGTPVKQFKFSSGTSDTEKKLQVTSFLQTVKLLKNAGFFRAYITKLSLFYRVIGGLCWCITSSGVAVDVTSCSEKTWILDKKYYLRKSKHAVKWSAVPLQANQISQCNDFGALLPVIKFLCDAVIKWRLLTGILRASLEMEFDSKGFVFPERLRVGRKFLHKVLNRYTE